jgi:hypothetical protein
LLKIDITADRSSALNFSKRPSLCSDSLTAEHHSNVIHAYATKNRPYLPTDRAASVLPSPNKRIIGEKSKNKEIGRIW